MSLEGTSVQILSFVLGVVSSLVASWVIVQRHRAPLRLRFRAVLKLIERLAARIRESGYVPDHVIAIDRNSGVVGSILCGLIGQQAVISVNLVHTRTGSGARTSELDALSTQVLSMLAGRKVLLLIACNGTGTSLAKVQQHLESLGDLGPSEVRTAALYTTASPILTPNYAGIVIDDDARLSMNLIVSRLPWMTPRWIHSLGTERLLRRSIE